MKILITQRELIKSGGTELVTVELALELSARGHRVAIYCPRPGALTELVKARAVGTWASLSDLPWTPDVIHGHHHLPAVAAMARFESVPAIYCWNGFRPWVERPPAHPQIAKYVVVCGWMVPRLQADLQVPADRIVTIPNFVNTRRFSRIRDPARPLLRALIYGHGGFSDEELARLGQACMARGLTLAKIGYPYGNANPSPESFLPDFDLVFAIGRCAIEALACGCAVAPILPGLAGGLVTPATFARWAHSNFSPLYFTTADQADANWLDAQILAYDPATQAQTTAMARSAHDLQGAVSAYEAVHAEALAAPREARRGLAFAPYLETLAPRADELWARSEQLPNAERRAAEAEAKARQMTRELGDLTRLNQRLARALKESNWLARELIHLLATGHGPLRARERERTLSMVARLLRNSGARNPDGTVVEFAEAMREGEDEGRRDIGEGGFDRRTASAVYAALAEIDSRPCEPGDARPKTKPLHALSRIWRRLRGRRDRR